MMKVNLFAVMLTVLLNVFPSPASGQMRDSDIIRANIDITREVTSELDKLFQEFSDGYVEAGYALERISLLKNEYNKAVGQVPEACNDLNFLVKRLFSQIENYFIYFKSSGREDLLINTKIAGITIQIAKEIDRLSYYT